MKSILRRVVRAVAYLAAAVIIGLAVLVGFARLLLPQIPEYQDEIRQQASAATGFNVEFQRISASWPLRGPELRFYDVALYEPDGGELVLTAGELAVGVSVTALLRERRVVLNRVGIRDTGLTVERGETGNLRLQGRDLASFLERFGQRDNAGPGMPSFSLDLEDINVTYIDRGRTDAVVELTLTGAELAFGRRTIFADAAMELRGPYGESLGVTLIDLPQALLRGAAAEAGRPKWLLEVEGDSLDLGVWLPLLLGIDTPVGRDARGSFVISAEMQGFVPQSVAADTRIDNLPLSSSSESLALRGLAGRFEWARRDSGWLFAANNFTLENDGFVWPRGDIQVGYDAAADGDGGRFTGSAEFVRVQDLRAVARALASPRFADEYLAVELRGDLTDFSLAWDSGQERAAQFEFAGRVAGAAWRSGSDAPALSGISGEVAGDQNGGRLQLASTDAEIVLPGIFRNPLYADSIDGLFVWRSGDAGLRILSDNIRIATQVMSAASRMEITIPADGEPVEVDIAASTDGADAVAALQFVPMRRFNPNVVKWLDRAIGAGRLARADFQMRGRLSEFPFRDGNGIFRLDLDLADGTFNFAEGWPPIEGLDARIVFDGASLNGELLGGTLAGVPVQGRRVTIRDLKQADVEVRGRQLVSIPQLLRFARETPVAAALGPIVGDLTGRGTVQTGVDLRLPVRRLGNWSLDLNLAPRGATLGLRDFPHRFTDIRGNFRLRNTRISARAVRAKFLDQPVTANVAPVDEPGAAYSHAIEMTADMPLAVVAEAFSLPFAAYLAGISRWDGTAFIPLNTGEGKGEPLRLSLASDMAGAVSRLPPPAAKESGVAEPLSMDILFPAEGALEIYGETTAAGFALRLLKRGEDWRVERGRADTAGGAQRLPDGPRFELTGALARLDLGEWLSLDDDPEVTEWDRLPKLARLAVGELDLFGAIFRDLAVDARQQALAWQVSVRGPALAGEVTVPASIGAETPLVLDLERLWLTETRDDPDDPSADPRDVPPLRAQIDDFVLDKMRFGALTAELASVADGIVASPITAQGDGFTLLGDGAWLVADGDPAMQRSRLRLMLNTSDVERTLTQLDYPPVVKSERATASADLTWPGPPDADFLERASGTFSVSVRDGQMLELDPGGGRLLGLFSVTALPQRLALDFRDVFDEGLNFESFEGSFDIENGEAYTCNLGLEGPVADLGIVGRASLSSRDYDQLAVVRPHVSNVFALGGALAGGPAAGAAMLLISQIFKKPLSTLGETYYAITGSWDEPAVERIQRGAVDGGRFSQCEADLAELLE